jgi:hypothetical protein
VSLALKVSRLTCGTRTIHIQPLRMLKGEVHVNIKKGNSRCRIILAVTIVLLAFQTEKDSVVGVMGTVV